MNARSIRHLAVMVALLGGSFTAQAVNYYWRTDIGSGNWSDAAKWSPSVVPGISDTAAFTLEQTAPFTVSFTADASSKLSLGTTVVAKPVVVTFDLNGYTLTHTNGTLDAHRALAWTILNGTLWAHPTSTLLSIGYYQGDWVPKVTIGAGATYLHNGTTYPQVGSRSAGELVIRDGGKLITQASAAVDALRLGATTSASDGYTNYTARMTVTGAGSVWSNRVGGILLSSHALATAELNVTDNGLLVHTGSAIFVANVAGGNASMNLASGGVLDARLASGYISIGNAGTGTVTVTGTGSKLLAVTNQHLYLGNTAAASHGTLIIEEGGLVEKLIGNHNFYVGNRDNARGRLIVRDGGLLRWAGGQGAMVVGGQGTAAGADGELLVTGATARVIFGEFSIGQTRGSALVTVAGGGTLEFYRQMYVGRIATNSVSAHGGRAKVVVTGTGSVLKKSALTTADLPNASMSVSSSLGVGGCGFQGWSTSGLLYASGSTYGPGGKGEVVVENGGLLSLNGYIGVYTNSTLRIDGGHTQSAYVGLETNAVLNAVLRAGDANGTALMTATTEVRLWGATLNVELGQDFTPAAGAVYTLISGPLHATLNRFTYGGSRLQDGALITVGTRTFKVNYTANAVRLTLRSTGTAIIAL